MDIWGLRRCSRPCLQTAVRQGFSRWEVSFCAGEHVLGSPLPITEQQQTVLCLPETRVRGSLSFPNSPGCGCKRKVVTLVFLKKKRWGKANHPNHKLREGKHLSEISQEHIVNLHKESVPKIPHKSVGIKWQLMSSQNHIKNTSKFFKKLKNQVCKGA